MVIPPCVHNKPRSQLLIFCIHVAESDGSVSPFLEDLDRSTLPPEFKKEGSDRFTTFNPKAKRVLDVSLVHTLPHKRLAASFACHLYNRNHWVDVFSTFSDVWRVRFTSDGRYLVTGCSWAALIYDTETGDQIWFGLFLVRVGRWGPWI